MSLIAVALGIDPARALVRRRIGIEMQRLVDDRQLVLIVEEAGVGGDLRVDTDPELHVRLEFGRARQQRVSGGREA